MVSHLIKVIRPRVINMIKYENATPKLELEIIFGLRFSLEPL